MSITPEFVLAVVDKIIWPFAFVAIVFLLRNYIGGLILKFKKFIYKSPDHNIQLDAGDSETKIENKEQASPEIDSPKDNSSKAPEDRPAENVKEAEVDLFIAFIEETPAKEDSVIRAYERLQHLETDQIKKLKNEAYYLTLRYKFLKDRTALEKLENLTKNKLIESNAHESIGRCYLNSNQLELATKEFEVALLTAKSDNDKTQACLGLAETLFSLDKKAEARLKIEVLIGEVADKNDLALLYKKLALFYETDSDYERRAIALTKALEYKPGDEKMLFDTAYSFSETMLDELSLIHYEELILLNPKEAKAINNLGVLYDKLDMQIRSIEMYKKSCELKETLAAANLSYRYMNAGFKDEADSVLNSIKNEVNLHPNVGRAIADLADKKDKESKILKEAEATGKKEQRFISKFGHYYFNNSEKLPGITGKWVSENIEGDLTQNENQVEFLYSKGGDKFKLLGNMNNCAGKLSTFGRRYTTPLDINNIVYSTTPNQEGYMYFDKITSELEILLIGKHDKKTEFITLKRDA